jgi:hypothetical protein
MSQATLTTDSRPVRFTVGRHTADVEICLVLMLAAGFCVWWVTGLHEHIQTLTDSRADDVWFEADVARVYYDMTSPGANHHRTNVHPLFPLLTIPLVGGCVKVFGLSKMQAVRVLIAAGAALWIALFYTLLRLLRCRRLDAVVFSLVAASSAGAMFWSAIPETYLFGSLTIIAVLVIAAVAESGRRVPAWLDVAAGAASLSILVTNFMVWLASLVARYRLQPAIQLACNALMTVVLLWALEKYLLPSAQFFLGGREKTGAPPLGSALAVIFLHSMVAPEVWSLPNEQIGLWPKLSLQHTALGQIGVLKVIAIACWLGLLCAAAWALARLPRYPRFRATLALSIAGQIALHIVYGNETFLYALDWIPLFVTAAALASLTRGRWIVLTLAAIFAVTAGIHNAQQLKTTLALLASNST